MMLRLIKNPMTRRRFLRFREMKRSWISLWVLVILYGVSLGSELICNSSPLYVRFNGKSYFPVAEFYPEHEFAGNGKQTRPDYKKLQFSPFFAGQSGNFMIFPLVPYGPYESIDPNDIAVSDQVSVVFTPVPKVGRVNIGKDYSIVSADSFGGFAGIADSALTGRILTDYVRLPGNVRQAAEDRFHNLPSPFLSEQSVGPDGQSISVSLSTFSQRRREPATVRLTFRESESQVPESRTLLFDSTLNPPHNDIWEQLTAADRETIIATVKNRLSGPVDDATLKIGDRFYRIHYEKEDVRFPYRSVPGHIFGIDGAGRDVLARILYGLRTSLTFGLVLVVASMVLGIFTGAIQGYYGGIIDISAQRIIEIWSALPFLYIMILMGSVYGRSFSLLLLCYGLFNWIGISYYIRAEFLRLRKLAFVEAARCMGLPSWKIIFKHILPNAMVPVITFFPFSLVGAIGALAALDYLGFGLPPPTPSWGELLFQAQQYRWAWWLILYPSLALFAVMLLGVFVGEGVRNAYDPKRFSRLE